MCIYSTSLKAGRFDGSSDQHLTNHIQSGPGRQPHYSIRPTTAGGPGAASHGPVRARLPSEITRVGKISETWWPPHVESAARGMHACMHAARWAGLSYFLIFFIIKV
ncbi:hypothetical protein HPP92_025814 [Vanilla planifolia]|uniref:Uncharacterized protein n=1 Tax=Vanilla planifolia TaxID=51239 RepID=A0A835PIQ6_VANPL|nr:hypothetical protein HPP92_025814 [Vanilla planifolia]